MRDHGSRIFYEKMPEQTHIKIREKARKRLVAFDSVLYILNTRAEEFNLF